MRRLSARSPAFAAAHVAQAKKRHRKSEAPPPSAGKALSGIEQAPYRPDALSALL
jgi:hypothetical protein